MTETVANMIRITDFIDSMYIDNINADVAVRMISFHHRAHRAIDIERADFENGLALNILSMDDSLCKRYTGSITHGCLRKDMFISFHCLM
jgi:hypothetical protein